MALPSFLASSYYYFSRDNVTDVQTIMDDFATEILTTNSPVWTNPSGTRYVSPVDGYGRFMDLEFTRTDQYKLTMTLKDQNGLTIMARRIIIPSTSGCSVRIYTGQFHFCIDVDDFTVNGQILIGGIVDMAPEANNSHSNYVWGFGSRDTADTNTIGYMRWVFMSDSGTPALLDRVASYNVQVSQQPCPQRDTSGYRIFLPYGLWALTPGDARRLYAGRAYQMLWAPSDVGANGAEISAPVDAGVTGTFRVLSVPTYPDYDIKVVMRVP
jgi:hypothetical protein